MVGIGVVAVWWWNDFEEIPPHPKAKEKPPQGGRRGKIMFRMKPHTQQRCSEGSNKPWAHQGPETPKETETELV